LLIRRFNVASSESSKRPRLAGKPQRERKFSEGRRTVKETGDQTMSRRRKR